MSETRQTPYEKFKAVHRRLIGNESVWLAKDHILLVESTGVSETYKRFYFKDIQAVNIIKTKTNTMVRAVSGLCVAVLVLLNIWSAAGSGFSLAPLTVISICVGAALSFVFLKALFNGPSCKCLIYSFVQKETIRPVKHIKTADRFMAVIIPKIEAAQGVLTPDKLVENTERVEAPASQILKHAAPAEPKKISPIWHVLLFFSFLILSVFALGDILFRSPVLYLAGSLMFLIVLLVNITAVVRQVNSTLSLMTKTCAIISICLMGLTFAYGYVEFFFLMTQNVQEWFDAYNSHWEMARYYTQVNLFDYPVLLGFSIFFAVSYFLLGVTGLVSLWRHKG